MDNQHKLIKGYRDLSQEEIDLMNEIKDLASATGIIVDKVMTHLFNQNENAYGTNNDNDDDCECDRLLAADPFTWAGNAKDDLQTGFMKLIRSVAQPTTF